MKNLTLAIVSLVIAAICIADTAVHAGFTFLGPTPYLSAADSPFDLSGLGTKFFLEDFEDLEANTPGIREWFAGVGLGGSVDADDGVIDANGSQGRSATAGGGSCSAGTCGYNVIFQFNDMTFGKYPTRAGLVVTSGANDLEIFVRVTDALGEVADLDISDHSYTSQSVADDLFFGVVSPVGITEIGVYHALRRPPFPQNLLKIDHLQYGVPEPSADLLLGVFTVVFLTNRNSTRHLNLLKVAQ
jgi:hypothetical protein